MQSFTKSGSTYNYIYDEQGLRTRKIAPDGNVTKYLYNGTKLAAEIAPNYRLDFLYDENDMLYGFVKDGSAKYFYARDMLQNILGIIDTNGSPVVIYQYTAYGTSTVLQDTAGLASINPFRFKGYYFDSESGMYYCHTRYYVPEWCRWLNADHPSFLQPDSLQGLNLYTYCGNNPIRRVDSKGTDWNSFWNDVGDYFKTNWDAIVGTIASIALVAGGIAVTIVSAGALSWLGGTMVGAGIGGFIGGIESKVDGGSYWGGYLGGIISGGMAGLGTSFGPVVAFVTGTFGNFLGSLVTDAINDTTMDEYYFGNLVAESLTAGFVNIGAMGVGKAIGLLNTSGWQDLFAWATVWAGFLSLTIYEKSLEFFRSFGQWLRSLRFSF